MESVRHPPQTAARYGKHRHILHPDFYLTILISVLCKIILRFLSVSVKFWFLLGLPVLEIRKKLIFLNNKHGYLFHTWSDKAVKGTVVNRAML